MWTTTTLSEYLLGYRDETGGVICSLGITRYTIPIFPAGMTVTFNIVPRPGAFADILFFGAWSAQMIPNAFTWETAHEGVITQSGLLTALLLSQPHSMWMVITERNPILTNVVNVTNIPQYFEGVDMSLAVPSEPNLKKIFELIKQWGGAVKGVPRPAAGGVY